jgi:hypothetical protein
MRIKRADMPRAFKSLGLATAAVLACGSAVAQPAPPAQQPAPIGLELGGHLGAAVRVGDGPHFEIIERAGVSFGAFAFLTPEPAFSLGLAFEHTDLGRERSAAGYFGAFEVIRDLNTLWATVRLNLLRGELGALGLSFGPGLAWQSADAAGVTTPLLQATPFACSGSDAADLALRAGLGGSLALGGGATLSAGATLDNVRLSSDIMDGCVPGAGSVTLIGIRAALSYRFDVGRYVR